MELLELGEVLAELVFGMVSEGSELFGEWWTISLRDLVGVSFDANSVSRSKAN